MASGNLFQNLLSSLFSSDDNAIKRKMLKRIAKNLSKTKYHFLRASAHEVDPSMAKFFYEMYNVISPAQLMFTSATPTALKTIVIDLSLSDEQKKIIEELSEDNLTKLASSTPLKQITEQANMKIEKFNADFSNEKIRQFDSLYTKLILLKNFVQYDFYFLLKKFDNTLKERNFSTPPKFQAIGSSYLVEDIKNFTAVAWPLLAEPEWDNVFKVLKNIKGVEPIAISSWKKLLIRLRQLRDQKVFEMMIQLMTDNPGFREVIKPEEYHVIDDFILQTRKTAEDVLSNLKQRQTAGKVDNFLNQIFGNVSIEPLKNYNENGSEAFIRKGLPGFKYADPLAYLKQFLLGYVKKDVRELSDILVVRGEWTNQSLSQPMSEASHQLMDTAGRISMLDEKLAENGEYGLKLKTFYPRVERDKEAKNISETLLGDANNEAAQVLLSARQNMITFAKNLKMALEDFVKPHPELIRNWRDLDRVAEGKLKQRCVDVYKKLYAFISLLQNFHIEISDPK